MEEAQNSVENEAVPQEQTPAEPRQQEEQGQSKARENFRRLEGKARDLENELRIQREINERLLAMTKREQPQAAPDELDQIADDDYLPKGKVQKLIEKKANEIAEKTVESYLAKRDQSKFLDKLKSKYSDFSEIVNNETLGLLEEQNPELAQTIADIKDPYKIGVQSYNYIKAMGLHTKTVDAARKREVDKKLEKNEKSIQSPTLYDKRPMAQAFKLTEQMKSDLYSEMMGYAKMAGAVPDLQ